jgi:mannonate dehydratase
MKLGIGFPQQHVTDDNLLFAKQLGVTHIVVHNPRLGDRGILELDQLNALKDLIHKHDLEFAAIENLPNDHWNDVLHAGPKRDEQIDNIGQTLRNMGKAEIPILGYYFSIVKVWGHWRNYKGGGRGGCGIKSFDLSKVPDTSTHETGAVSIDAMWQRLEYYLKRIIPIAEEAGVKLAAHQDDPPAEYLRGIGRLLTNHDNMQRLLDIVPSPNNGLEFCQGTVAEMAPDKVIEAIHRFGKQQKIFYVHFRNVRGQFPKFDEVFIDEGDVNMFDAIQAYKDVQYDGVLIPDHCPIIQGESNYRHRGMAFSLGYMRALLQFAQR